MKPWKDTWKDTKAGMRRWWRRVTRKDAAPPQVAHTDSARPPSAPAAAEQESGASSNFPKAPNVDDAASAVTPAPDRGLVRMPPIAPGPVRGAADRAAAPDASPTTQREGDDDDDDAIATPTAHAAGRFFGNVFGNHVGQRAYRLFIPSGSAPAAGRPLLVMLHGCKQNALDFATGTRMNARAQELGWVVLYPEQNRQANPLGCWNWFRRSNQQRDQGEPAIIADMTREVIRAQGVDARRIFVAGISAGGAMASILASNYPDVFAAVGVHSGLPHAAASDLISAMRAMKRGPSPRAAQREPNNTLPTIVFHGDHDRTVHPSNGEEVIARARWTSRLDGGDTAVAPADVSAEQGEVPGGHAYTRTVHRDAQGRVDAEHWLVHGSAHAWSGGDPAGSYTDPLGPDASREMLRFFAEHPRRDTTIREPA